jgi:hypothetical protein
MILPISHRDLSDMDNHRTNYDICVNFPKNTVVKVAIGFPPLAFALSVAYFSMFLNIFYT